MVNHESFGIVVIEFHYWTIYRKIVGELVRSRAIHRPLQSKINRTTTDIPLILNYTLHYTVKSLNLLCHQL